ncbi:response regulator [Coleofasciculus sp. LEGE 07092]|nr:response regulator [Coleofasciculus sp. LEGE 07081]MBE9146991.1 response regulator [Coleofasciculus sp. LEGE 07092]
MKSIHSEPIEQRLQQLKEEQQLIFNQVDNAIALFNSSHQLVLFNQRFTQVWEVSVDWLQEQPPLQDVWERVVARGYWSAAQAEHLLSSLPTAPAETVSFPLEQADGIHLNVKVTLTSDGGYLFTFHDITAKAQAQREAILMQTSLNSEVKRLRFLQGLTERLQPAGELWEIGQFALTYLVQTTGAAFGDVKVIAGEGKEARAGVVTNKVSTQFIATYGTMAVSEMEAVLKQGIPYGQGLLWQVVETGEPLFVEDYKNHPQAVAAFRHAGVSQLGIFPIPGATGKIIGVLTLESRDGKTLQELPQQDMLLAACRTLGVAIERAQAQERLRQANEDLERASQLKSEFLASMSHELRTPLNSILGFSDLLQRQTGGSMTSRQLSHVQAIKSSGEHLLALINDILDLSKIEAGKVDLELTPVSIPALCNHCLKMIQPRADKKRLALLLELDYRLQEVFLDERRVRQILVNLLSNAVKFTPEAGTVKLTGRLAYGCELQQAFRPDHSPVNCSTPYLCLEIIDSGIGIPDNKLNLLFRPFQQVDSSLTRRHEGTGLGLALTKRLAELHGGTVSVESKENQGSTFRVWLPLTEMRSSLAAKNTVSDSESSRRSFLKNELPVGDSKRILVVEDQPLNQALILEVLELEGHLVELLYDGQTMLETLHSPLVKPQSLPHLILMDIQLPQVDGFELIRQLKAHPTWQNVPVIALTAMAMAGDRDRCLEAGADDYLSKPLDLEKVITTVRSWLDTSTEAPRITN